MSNIPTHATSPHATPTKSSSRFPAAIQITVRDPKGDEYAVKTSVESLRAQLGKARLDSSDSTRIGVRGPPAYVTDKCAFIKSVTKIVTSGLSGVDAARAIYEWVNSTISNEARPPGARSKHPLETLLSSSGTNDDRTVLAASMGRTIGLETALIRSDSLLRLGIRNESDTDGYRYRGKRFTPVGCANDLPISSEIQISAPWIDGAFRIERLDGTFDTVTIPASALTRRAMYKECREICKLKGEAISKIIERDARHLQPLAELICEACATPEDQARTLLLFVQTHVRYTSDPPNRDAFQFPLETVFRGKGDCEDSALLYASLCTALGIPVVLINPVGHIAVGVAGRFSGDYFINNGIRYYYAETTKPGWSIGVVPPAQDKPTRTIALRKDRFVWNRVAA